MNIMGFFSAQILHSNKKKQAQKLKVTPFEYDIYYYAKLMQKNANQKLFSISCDSNDYSSKAMT